MVDDEPRYLRLVRFNLEAEGYRVSTVESGEDCLAALATQPHDLVILDVMLPGQDGYEVCERIREASTIPIIMLTALGDEEERVRGLRLGADDYIPKPFSAPELAARIEAVLRRAHTAGASEDKASYSYRDLHVDFLTRGVSLQGKEVRLSPTEYRVLHQLATNAGKTLTHDYILEKVWGPGYGHENEVLRVTIWRLRQKLERDPQDPKLITTVPGVGYLLPSPA